jgi:hypothetical protein
MMADEKKWKLIKGLLDLIDKKSIWWSLDLTGLSKIEQIEHEARYGGPFYTIFIDPFKIPKTKFEKILYKVSDYNYDGFLKKFLDVPEIRKLYMSIPGDSVKKVMETTETIVNAIMEIEKNYCSIIENTKYQNVSARFSKCHHPNIGTFYLASILEVSDGLIYYDFYLSKDHKKVERIYRDFMTSLPYIFRPISVKDIKEEQHLEA